MDVQEEDLSSLGVPPDLRDHLDHLEGLQGQEVSFVVACREEALDQEAFRQEDLSGQEEDPDREGQPLWAFFFPPWPDFLALIPTPRLLRCWQKY